MVALHLNPDRRAIWRRLGLLDPNALLTPAEAGEAFNVSPQTVTRWEESGKITAVRTLGGHRRFRVRVLREYLVTEEARRR